MYVLMFVSEDDVNQRRFQQLCVTYEAVCQRCLAEVENLKVICIIFRSRRMHAVHRCDLLLQMSHVACVCVSVCLCFMLTDELCKTA